MSKRINIQVSRKLGIWRGQVNWWIAKVKKCLEKETPGLEPGSHVAELPFYKNKSLDKKCHGEN